MDSIDSKAPGELVVKNEDIEAVGALITAFEGYVQVKETDTTADNKNYTPLNVVLSKYGNKDIFNSFANFTALQRVLDKYDLDAAEILIDVGADPNTRNSDNDYTALHVAASKADTEMIKYLLSKGANINIKRKTSGRTPLKAAAINNSDDSHFETIELLLKNGADVNDGEPLASVLDNVNLVKLFLEYKVNPTETVLIRAVSFENEVDSGSVEVVRLLLNNGFDAKSLDSHNESILLSAVSKGNVEIVKLLIDHGFKYNNTLLHTVADCNKGQSHYEVSEMLLKMGLDVNARDATTLQTPIHIMIGEDKSDVEILELFLNHKPDLTSQDWNGDTPLVIAIWSENLEFIKLLVERGSDVNAVNFKNGKTPLHKAIFRNYDLKMVKLLLINGADINALDHDGCGPLVSALSRCFCEYVPARCLKFMLKYSDLNVVNEKGANVLDQFENIFWHKKCECKVVILKHLAKLQTLNIPLHPSILKSIRRQTELGDYFDKCNKELSLTKETKLRNSWITFFNLLIDNKRKLKNYAGNQDLVKDYKKSDWLKIFPIYGAEMQENMKKGIERRKLFDKSTLILNDLLPIFNLTHLVIHNVLDCVSTKELSKLCEKGAKRSQFL